MRPALEVLETRLLLTHPVPLPQIEQEPNDTPETANVIRLDTEVADHDPTAGLSGHMRGELNLECALMCTGPVQVPPDQDWFKFEAPADQRLKLNVVGDALRGVGILLVHDGQELASDTDSTDGLAIEQDSGAGGTFYVRLFVPGFDPIVLDRSNCGHVDRNHRLECRGHIPYVLNVNVVSEVFVEHEPNDTLEQANSIQLSPRLFCFEVCVALPDRTGATTGTAPMDASEPASGAIRSLPPALDGSQRGFIRGSLDNQVVPSACDPTPGADPCQTPNFQVVASDMDFFSFSAEAERKITITLHGNAAERGVLSQLLDANGSVVATAQTQDRDGDRTHGSARSEYFTVAGGQFFVQVGPDSDGTRSEPYTLTVEVAPDPHHEHEPNNDFDTANAVDLTGNPERHCDLICPLTSTADDVVANDSSQPRHSGPDVPLPIGRDQALRGFVQGELTYQVAGGGPLIPDVFDEDVFSFQVSAERDVHLALTGDLANHRGQVTLYDADKNVLVSDSDPADGIAVDWSTHSGGTFYVRVQFNADAQQALITTCDNDGQFPCSGTIAYTLHVAAAPLVNPVQGPNEHEPNDTLAQANVLELHDLPIGACCIELRAGDAHGIAGGPTNDQDSWQFEIHAGEHVTVAVHSLLRAKLHESSIPTAQVVVYDANGNEIGRGGDDGKQLQPVEFESQQGGNYYGVVSVAADPAHSEPVHYRLGVLARSKLGEPEPRPTVDQPPDLIVLKSGGKFDYTDSSGDQVHVRFRGSGGHATVTFTGPSANGSDVASVVVDGVRRGGSLSITTKGSAEVGSIEIHGLARGRRSARGFGTVQIDGNLGSFASDVNVRAIGVDGLLGTVAARDRQIGQINAAVFDRAMAEVGSIRTIHIEQDMATALFHRFLPREESQPSDSSAADDLVARR